MSSTVYNGLMEFKCFPLTQAAADMRLQLSTYCIRNGGGGDKGLSLSFWVGSWLTANLSMVGHVPPASQDLMESLDNYQRGIFANVAMNKPISIGRKSLQ